MPHILGLVDTVCFLPWPLMKMFPKNQQCLKKDKIIALNLNWFCWLCTCFAVSFPFWTFNKVVYCAFIFISDHCIKIRICFHGNSFLLAVQWSPRFASVGLLCYIRLSIISLYGILSKAGQFPGTIKNLFTFCLSL